MPSLIPSSSLIRAPTHNIIQGITQISTYAIIRLPTHGITHSPTRAISHSQFVELLIPRLMPSLRPQLMTSLIPNSWNCSYSYSGPNSWYHLGSNSYHRSGPNPMVFFKFRGIILLFFLFTCISVHELEMSWDLSDAMSLGMMVWAWMSDGMSREHELKFEWYCNKTSFLIARVARSSSSTMSQTTIPSSCYYSSTRIKFYYGLNQC